MSGSHGKIRLAVLFGGRSGEHAISCISAGSVLRALDRDRYDVVLVGIAPDGRWVLAPDDPAALSARGRELPSVDTAGAAVALPADPTAGGLVAMGPARAAVTDVDVVFPLLHGPFGEDGTVQGLLEMAGVPYVGSGVFASAAAMDKAHMKTLLTAVGLEVTPYVVVRRGEEPSPEVKDALTLPVFVKPARGGSSLGITRITDWGDLPAALATARESDPKVLLESGIAGREIECGVLGGLGGGPPEASPPAEVRVADDAAFYDFEAKYLDEGTAFDVPADVPAEVTARIQDVAVRAFRALDCEGLARVDVFLAADGRVIVNEVNTMPGFTPASMFPRMWAAGGLDYPALVDRLVRLGLERGTGLR